MLAPTNIRCGPPTVTATTQEIGRRGIGKDYALELLELVFNQDLNGDGTVGLTTTVIQTDTNAFGSTSLTEVANEYFS